MKKVTFLAALMAAFSFVLMSVGQAHAHPGCQGIGFEDKDDCDGDECRQLLEEEEGEAEQSSAQFDDDCEDGDDAERARLDECEGDDAERTVVDDCEDDDAERAAFDDCEDDDESRKLLDDECEGEGDEE